MPQAQRIRFTDGVRNVEGAPVSSPSDLTNAEIARYGFVRALNGTTSYGDTISPTIKKPLARSPITDNWVGDFDALDFAQGILYAADDNSGNPVVRVYQEDTNDQDGEPAYVESATSTIESIAGNAIGTGKYVTYRFVPVNKRGEAGPWFDEVVKNSEAKANIKWDLEVSDGTQWVEVYRTTEYTLESGGEKPSTFYYLDRFSTIAAESEAGALGTYNVKYHDIAYDGGTKTGIDYFGVNTDLEGYSLTGLHVRFNDLLRSTPAGSVKANTEYKIYGTTEIEGRIYPKIENTDGSSITNFDSDALFNWVYREGRESEDSASNDATEPESFEFIQDHVTVTFIDPNEGETNTQTDKLIIKDEGPRMIMGDEKLEPPKSSELRRRRNVHAVVGGTYKGFTANAMYYAGGVMYYGGPKWPTKEPEVCYQVNIAGEPSEDVRLQLEYETRDGTVYGPYVEETGTVISATYQGEAALNVHVYDTNLSQWVHQKRMVADNFGGYGTKVFDAREYQNYISVDDVRGSQDYITEKNVILMSKTDRPWECTYGRQFNLPGDETVRAIFPARRREEDQKAYDFYVASEKNIYICKPDLRQDIVYRDPLPGDTGIVTVGNNALHASVPGGAVVYGTNRRLLFLNGRQVRPLVEEEAKLWDAVNDLTFDPIENEIVVASNTGIWRYDMDRNMWAQQRDVVSDLVFWDQKNKSVVLRGEDDTIHEVTGNGTELTAEVITQYLSNVNERTSIESVEIDYNRTSYSDTDETTWATLQHSVRSPNVLQVDEEPGSHPNKKNYTFNAPALRSRYPSAKGRGHRFRVKDFSELREIKVMIQSDETTTKD